MQWEKKNYIAVKNNSDLSAYHGQVIFVMD